MADLNTISGLHYEMMRRCYNKNSISYKDYGEKGIKVCDEWKNKETFKKWCNDNGYEKGMRLQRIDSKKDYCPENCVFGNVNCKKSNRNKKMKERVIFNKRRKEESFISGKLADDELYSTFNSMHSRCENKNHISYKNYGGRGIIVCCEWSGKNGFYAFKKWCISNGWKRGLTLDRIDNNVGYYPENCRFVTVVEQCNNKRNNIIYEFNGKEMTLGMIAKQENIKYGLLYSRVRLKGMSVYDAIIEIKNRL